MSAADIKRLARIMAIGFVDDTFECEGDRPSIAAVRAILTAMREPTEEMRRAFVTEFSDDCLPERFERGWRAAIDTLLGET